MAPEGQVLTSHFAVAVHPGEPVNVRAKVIPAVTDDFANVAASSKEVRERLCALQDFAHFIPTGSGTVVVGGVAE